MSSLKGSCVIVVLLAILTLDCVTRNSAMAISSDGTTSTAIDNLASMHSPDSTSDILSPQATSFQTSSPISINALNSQSVILDLFGDLTLSTTDIQPMSKQPVDLSTHTAQSEESIVSSFSHVPSFSSFSDSPFSDQSTDLILPIPSIPSLSVDNTISSLVSEQVSGTIWYTGMLTSGDFNISTHIAVSQTPSTLPESISLNITFISTSAVDLFSMETVFPKVSSSESIPIVSIFDDLSTDVSTLSDLSTVDVSSLTTPEAPSLTHTQSKIQPTLGGPSTTYLEPSTIYDDVFSTTAGTVTLSTVTISTLTSPAPTTTTQKTTTTKSNTVTTPKDATVSTIRTLPPKASGLSTGGKVAIGIIIPLAVIGFVILGVYIYRRTSARDFKNFFAPGVRYRTYTNDTYADDEVSLGGSWRKVSDP